jgi:hypothetical protein
MDSMTRAPAAVDVQDFAGHEAGGFEEQHHDNCDLGNGFTRPAPMPCAHP